MQNKTSTRIEIYEIVDSNSNSTNLAYEFPDSDMETEEEEEIYVDGLAEEGYKTGGAGYIGKTTRFNVSH